MTALSPGFDSYASLAFAPFQDLWAEPKTALRRLHLTLSYAFPPAHMDHRLPEELVELVAPASTQDAAATTTALTLEPYWCWPWQLEELGILGINRRNSSYVFCHNDRAHYPLVDNKVLTKEVCGEQGIASAETYGVIESVADVQYLITWIENYPSFVIKPARGAGGKGILVIDHHDGIDFVTASGRKLSIAQIQHHLTTVLAGTYSLGQQPDVTIVEQRVLSHPALAPITVGGVPDIRVIVFQGVPAMAMTRLPTQLSEGRANLHQGAVAAAIDLVSGQTSGGVWQNHMIDAHPDTGHSLEGFQIPYWDQILAISTKLGHSLGLGYIGVDLVIDSEQGPMVLDVNARPGLAIQIANGQGLHHRLAFIANQLPEALEADRCLDLLPQLSQSSLNQSSLNQRALHDRV
jgi:alpha-L-glutamate ligase-like protein